MIIRPPEGPVERAAYYDLRWRVLRAPWDQPRGSEKDEWENDAFHLAAFDHGHLVGVGRLHRLDDTTAQIRCMAVHPDHKRRGIGRLLLAGLEAEARAWQAARIELNAREPATPFYEREGYRILRPGPTLWDIIPHHVMEKHLTPP